MPTGNGQTTPTPFHGLTLAAADLHSRRHPLSVAASASDTRRLAG